MTIPLEYNLSVIGQRDVDRAFLALEQRVAQHVKRVEQLTGLHGRGGVGGVANDRSSATGIRSAARLEAEATRAAAREARARAKNEEQWANYTRTIKDRHLREDEKREKQQTRTHEQEAKKRARTEEQLRKSSERAAMRSAHDAGAARMGFARAVGGTLGGLGRSAMALTGLSGGAVFANAVHDQARVGGIASELAGKIVGKGATVQQIRAQQVSLLAKAGSVKGFSQEAMLGIADSYGGIAGDYGGGMGMAADIAKLARATGGDASEMAEVAGNASMSLSRQYQGEELRKRVMQTTRMFAGQGEMGAVEIKDLAKYAGRLTAPASQYAGDKEANFVSLGTMAQVARGSGSAASAEEATTAVARFQNDVIDKRAELKKLGVNVFDAKTGKLRAPDELVADIMQQTGGSIVKTNDIFGQMAAKTIAGFSNIFQAGEAQEKGGGRKAVMAEFAKFKGATLTEADVNTRAEAIGQGQGATFTESMKLLNMAIGKELLPVVTKFTAQMGEAAPSIGKFASAVASTAAWFLDNPFKGLGAIVAGVITKELVSAGIGKIISSALSGGGGGVGGAAGGAIAGAAGKLGAAGLAAAVGFSTYSSTYAALAAADDSDSLGRSLSSASIATTNEYNRLGAGPDKEVAAKAQLAMLSNSEGSIDRSLGNRGLVTTMVGGGGAEGIAAKQVIAEQRAAATAMLDAAQALKMGALAGGRPNQGGHPTWYGAPMSKEE